jgi:hypothetical protein
MTASTKAKRRALVSAGLLITVVHTGWSFFSSTKDLEGNELPKSPYETA